ncbi:MAG: hypothetical protein ACOCSL_00720, partial [Thermoplasmatota archaeon]
HRDAPVSILKPLVVLAGLCIFVGATSTIWMKNVIIPASKVIVDQSTIEPGVYLELTTLVNTGGLTILATIPIGIFLFLFLKILDKKSIIASILSSLKNKLENNLRLFLVDVELTDAIRYVILGQLLILLLILL